MLTALTFLAGAVLVPQSGIVHRPDVNLPYKIEGKGAPVLILSGGPGFTSDYLQSIIDGGGREKFRWILIEQRGTPRARLAHPSAKNLEMKDYVDDLEALRVQLGLKKWTVVGQSWGSCLAEGYTVAHPDRVTSLALLDTPGPDMEWTKYGGDNVNRELDDEDKKLAAEVAKRDAKDPNAMALDGFLANLPGYFYSRETAMKSKSLFKSGAVEGTTIGIVFSNLIREKWNAAPGLHHYKGPALVIQGRQDFLGEYAAVKAAQALPHGELCFIERAGHIAWIDNPGPFFSRLGSFLKRNAK